MHWAAQDQFTDLDLAPSATAISQVSLTSGAPTPAAPQILDVPAAALPIADAHTGIPPATAESVVVHTSSSPHTGPPPATSDLALEHAASSVPLTAPTPAGTELVAGPPAGAPPPEAPSTDAEHSGEPPADVAAADAPTSSATDGDMATDPAA